MQGGAPLEPPVPVAVTGSAPTDVQAIQDLRSELGAVRSQLEMLRALMSEEGRDEMRRRLADERERPATRPTAASPRSRVVGDRARCDSEPHEARSVSPGRAAVTERPRDRSPRHRLSSLGLRDGTMMDELADGTASVTSRAASRSPSPSGARTPRSKSASAARMVPVTRGMRRGDMMDDLWCSVLRLFPEHPDWMLVKEKTGIYRIGGPGGKKIICRTCPGGPGNLPKLQVRVGAGWEGAISFMERNGPAAMGDRRSRAST